MSARRKVLLIDDNDHTLDLLELFLHRDYDILTAENGFQGLKVAQAERPDLIMTDIMMPVMDGVAFFNELRRREETARTPVIALTSFAEPTTVKSLLNVGFAGVLAKPFQRASILATVARQLPPPEEEHERAPAE